MKNNPGLVYEVQVRMHRGMRGDDARKVCPDLNLVQVPVAHGKADLTLYRASGKQVILRSQCLTL